MHKSPTSVRGRQIGLALRQSRRVAGMAGEFVAGKLGVPVSKISRLESGQRPPKLEDVAGLLALYGVTGETRENLPKLCKEAESGEIGWWRPRGMCLKMRTLLEFESISTRINCEPQLVPGLLQTGEYANAVLRDVILAPEDEIEQLMVMRLAQHSLLVRNHPPRLLVIVNEQALRAPVGGPGVHGRQLRRLVNMTQHAHVTIRVIPDSVTVHPGLFGAFMKLEFSDTQPLVFLENRTSSLFLEDIEDISDDDAALDKLLSLALSRGESAHLLAELAYEANQTTDAKLSLMA